MSMQWLLIAIKYRYAFFNILLITKSENSNRLKETMDRSSRWSFDLGVWKQRNFSAHVIFQQNIALSARISTSQQEYRPLSKLIAKSIEFTGMGILHTVFY